MYDHNPFNEVKRLTSLEEDYNPKPPKKYDFPMEVESLVKERAKAHIKKLNDANDGYEYAHRFHYKGPRFKSSYKYASRPASTKKSAARGFSVAIYKKQKGTGMGYVDRHTGRSRPYKGELAGYVLPHHIGVKPHATKHLDEQYNPDSAPFALSERAKTRFKLNKAIRKKGKEEIKRSQTFNRDPKTATLRGMFKESALFRDVK